jgi:hypothetical protein
MNDNFYLPHFSPNGRAKKITIYIRILQLIPEQRFVFKILILYIHRSMGFEPMVLLVYQFHG